MPDKIYDLIIIGASLDGINAYNSLKRAAPDKSVLVISENFDAITTRNSVLKADRLEASVVFTQYKYGMFYAFISAEKFYCSKAMIIATGSDPVKRLDIKTTNVYYKLSAVKSRSKILPMVVVGGNKDSAEAALYLAKRYSAVYMCIPTAELSCGEDLKNQINNTENIIQLPLCDIKSCKNNKNDQLMSVVLNTFEIIPCCGIFVAVNRTPSLRGISKGLLRIDSNGYVITNENHETGLIPGLYAVGECCVKEAKARDASKLISSYLKTFGGK